jgi:predicted RNA-binding protein with TRAM domain
MKSAIRCNRRVKSNMNRNMNRGYGYGPRQFSRNDNDGGVTPVNVGDELDVKIEAVGEKGDGIAKKDGFVLFVPNTKEGDNVRVRVTKVLRRVGFAEVVGSAQGKESKPQREEYKEQAPEDSENFGEESADVQDYESEDTTDEDFDK